MKIIKNEGKKDDDILISLAYNDFDLLSTARAIDLGTVCRRRPATPDDGGIGERPWAGLS